jgi:DNA-binding transcriptional ArsR family regulator
MSDFDRDILFAALADTSRRLMLERLRATNGQTITELSDGLGITRQAATKHLAALEAAGLVVSQKHGRARLHYLNPVPIHTVALRWLERFNDTPLDVLMPAVKPKR